MDRVNVERLELARLGAQLLWVDGVYRGTVDRYRAGWIAIDQKTSTLELRSPGYYRAYYLVSADLKTWTVELLRVPKNH